jgi:predicted Holliday junction resolvase-like endonuclease
LRRAWEEEDEAGLVSRQIEESESEREREREREICVSVEVVGGEVADLLGPFVCEIQCYILGPMSFLVVDIRSRVVWS